MSNKRHSAKQNVSSSQSIVKKGTQGLTERGKNADVKAIVPASTWRALQLRNGKGGSFGTGEVATISGREKLELIAEDEMEKAKKHLYEANMNSSLRAPFQLETILKIAQSQMDAYVDFTNALHDPDLCYDIILHETEAHCPLRDGREDADWMRVPSFVAEQFSACVHNAHMLASAWVIVYESFRKLQEMGLMDREVYGQLKTDDEIRDVYFSVYELLKKLVTSLQQRLRSIAQHTPHYAPYFKSSSDSKDLHEFERSEIRRMYKSFLDSAIIELCLPGSKFSPQALYFCLHTTQEETPSLLKRCPQLMWDVVGDLAEAVRLMDIMETPLMNQYFDTKNEEETATFDEFARWDEAQAKSVRAAMDYSSFVNLVNPLTNLKNRSTLNKVWDRLNANYVRESGRNIDSLWQLVDARYRVPHFSTLTVPADMIHGASKSTGKELVRAGQNGKPKSTYVEDVSDGDDSATSMPPLKDMSNSEDEHEGFSSEDGNYSSEAEDDECDEDEDQDLRRKQREAIDRSLEDPDILDLDNDKYEDERMKNPFLSLLGNLRGRLFSSSAILRTDGEATATTRHTKPPTSKKPARKPPDVSKGSDELSTAQVSAKATVGDADDESDEPKSTAKKKKPKKKKKKKANSMDVKSPTSKAPTSPVAEPPRTPSPSPAPQVTSPTPLAASKTDKKPTLKSPSVKTQPTRSSLSETTAFASTTTLPLPHEEKAPSAHSYLKELSETKTKVKTRREPAVEVIPEKKERRNLFDRLRGRDRDVPRDEGKLKTDLNVFGRLKRRTVGYARKLIGVSAQDKKGSLRWEQFLQVMRELGFEYDPSTAGSSVRFDPPNPNDRSITFHKPHPDPTLYQYKLQEYRAKLEAYYGWSPEKFEKAVQGLGGTSDYEDD